jgi:hypothetical protein
MPSDGKTVFQTVLSPHLAAAASVLPTTMIRCAMKTFKTAEWWILTSLRSEQQLPQGRPPLRRLLRARSLIWIA